MRWEVVEIATWTFCRISTFRIVWSQSLLWFLGILKKIHWEKEVIRTDWIRNLQTWKYIFENCNRSWQSKLIESIVSCVLSNHIGLDPVFVSKSQILTCIMSTTSSAQSLAKKYKFQNCLWEFRMWWSECPHDCFEEDRLHQHFGRLFPKLVSKQKMQPIWQVFFIPPPKRYYIGVF